MIVQPSISGVISSGKFIAAGCFPVSFPAPSYHFSLVLASVVQSDSDACNSRMWE